MSILSSHAGSWHSDKWYRRAWYIWPQVASLLVVGWVFAGVLLKPVPWAEPQTQPQPPPNPPERYTCEQRYTPGCPQPNRDITACSQGNSRDALDACSRLIDKGLVGYYFNRAQIHFRNRAYDWAIEDFSAFIRLNPNSVAALNERGLSYAKKGEYDRAIADYTEAIRLDRVSVGPYINRGSAYEKKGELDKALSDFRAAGSTTASEDIKRVERAIVKELNDRGLSYAKKREYDRAIADYTEAIRLDRGSALSYSNRGSAYEQKGELDKALADFREAQNNGSTTASEDISRIERAIESLRSKYVVNGLDGLRLGGRVSPQSNEYQKYQCTPSDQFEGVTWCNKQRLDEKEPRGLYRSSYTIAHSREGTIYYLNRSQEPAFFNAGEVDTDIEHLSGKLGEQPRRVRPHVRLGPNTDGIIAIWGKVTLEPLDAAGLSELVAGRSPRKGILVDFIGNSSESARRGLDVYRVSGGPGFVWSASFNSKGQGTMRFFSVDPWALLPIVSKERTEAAPPTNYANPQNDCDRLAANPSDRGKPPSVPGVPYDSLMNQAKQAIEACALAAKQNPAELRYEYQMARAMEAQVPEKAVEIHKKLAGQKYPAAFDNLGWLMVKLHKDYGAAVTYFKTGSQLQDPDSMVSLVEMIDRGYVQTDRPSELKYQLLRTAADLGHQGAQLQIREEEEKLSAAQRQAAQNLRIMMDFLGVR
jgi:tetratricopeptide (TPR) repeat protein